jgi:predicted alpha/beta-hydrolase family hydrolase
VTAVAIDTPVGRARAHVRRPDESTGALVLGHGAGGGIDAPDLRTVAGAAHAEGLAVALLEQPYRVAGRRSPPRAPQLDAAWVAVVEQLRARELAGLPLVVGGRSSGARVACRTAETVGAIAVLCLAFPLVPPRRTAKPPESRLAELEAVVVPVLVVQGESDRFGIPPASATRTVVTVAGDHGLKKDHDVVAQAVRSWLATLVRS